MERLIEKLFEGTLEIPWGNRLVRSDKLPEQEVLQYSGYYIRLREGILGSLAPTEEIIYALGENPEREKEAYWCDDIEMFHLMFKVVPTFRFRRVHDRIHVEALLRAQRFSNPAVRATGFGIGQDIFDNLAISYHVRCLLGRIGLNLHRREDETEKLRGESITADQRQKHIERQRQKSRQLVARIEERKERSKRLEQQREGRYGPSELPLYSDERLRQDLDKYSWNWEKFMRARA